MNVSIQNNNPGASAKLTERVERKGVLLLDLEVSFPEATIPKPVVLAWTIPATDLYSVWNAGGSFSRYLGMDWAKRAVRSRLASGAPFYALVSSSDENRLTIAVSDPKTPIEIASGVCEETQSESPFRL